MDISGNVEILFNVRFFFFFEWFPTLSLKALCIAHNIDCKKAKNFFISHYLCI